MPPGNAPAVSCPEYRCWSIIGGRAASASEAHAWRARVHLEQADHRAQTQSPWSRCRQGRSHVGNAGPRGAQHERISRRFFSGTQSFQVGRHVGYDLLPGPLPGIEFGLPMMPGRLEKSQVESNLWMNLEVRRRDGDWIRTRICSSEQHHSSGECEKCGRSLGANRGNPAR